MAKCPECGTESAGLPFCPKCGSQRLGVEPATAAPAGKRPPGTSGQRAAVRASGAFLVGLGVLASFAGAYAMMLPATSVDQLRVSDLEGQDGGTARVHVTDGGVPVPNATLTFTLANGTEVATATTDAGGRAIVEMPNARLNVTAQDGNRSVSRTVIVFAGGNASVPIRMEDLEPATFVDPLFGTALRVMGAVLGLLAIVMVWGGIAALRLRQRPVAIAGGAVGLIMGLLMAAALGLVGFIPLLATVFALATIIKRRALFS